MLSIETLEVIKSDLARVTGIIRVDWDGLEPDDAIGELNDEYLTRFEQSDQLALLPYMLVCIEWLYLALKDGMGDQEKANFEEYILASWQWWYASDDYLLPYYDLEEEDAAANTTNAIAVEYTISALWDGYIAIAGGDTFVSAALITQICEYCLPPSSAFSSWHPVVGERLITRYPKMQSGDNPSRSIAKKFFELEIDLNTFDGQAPQARLEGDPDPQANRYLPLTLDED